MKENKEFTNTDRNEAAYRTLLYYNQVKSNGDFSISERDELISDLLTDLMHYVKMDLGVRFSELLERATGNFEAEVEPVDEQGINPEGAGMRTLEGWEQIKREKRTDKTVVILNHRISYRYKDAPDLVISPEDEETIHYMIGQGYTEGGLIGGDLHSNLTGDAWWWFMARVRHPDDADFHELRAQEKQAEAEFLNDKDRKAAFEKAGRWDEPPETSPRIREADKFIVCYIRQINPRSDDSAERKAYAPREDHYDVFIDGTSEENKKAAKDFYEQVADKDDTYSANMCQILKSTDY